MKNFQMGLVMKAKLVRLFCDESGGTTIEYALIATFISVFCLAVPTLIGGQLNAKFTVVSNALN